MAFSFESMNKRKSTMCPGVNSKQLGDIRNLKDFVGCAILVDGFFFTHSKKYGNDQVVIAGTVMSKDHNGEWQNIGQYLMNTPGRTYEEFASMSEDEEALASILRGELVMTGIKMAETKSGTTVVYTYRTGKTRYEVDSDVDEDGFMKVDDEEDLPFL